MPVVKLTQSNIAKLQIPEGKSRIEWVDADTPGLYLLATPNGSTFFLRQKISGKLKHIKICRVTAETSLAEVRKKAIALKAEIALGTDLRGTEKAKDAVLTFTEFFNDHYIKYVMPRKRSWKRDEELFRLRLKAEFGDKQLNQITRQQIQLFHTDLLATGLAPASCDHHVKLLKHALNLAIDWDLLTEKNPAARIPLFNRDNKVEHYLDDEQLEKLLTVLRTDGNRPICMVAMFLLSTGARLNEALQATWSQLDRPNRVWRIPASNSKSKRIRSVPLNDSALTVLSQLNTEGTFEHIFVNPLTKGPITSVHAVWNRLRKEAGLPHLRIHDLRHMYASFMVNSGRTLYEVQQILGHSNPSVTQRYSHLSSKSLQDAANSASIIIKGAMPAAA